MKKFLLLILILAAGAQASLFSGEKTTNFVIGEPLLSVNTNMIVHDAIYLGYNRQIWDLEKRFQAKKALRDKYIGDTTLFSNDPVINRYLNADKQAKVELDNYIQRLFDYFNGHNLNLNSSKKSIGLSLNINISKVVNVTKKLKQSTNFNEQFKTSLNKLMQIYGTKSIKMPFYSYVYFNGKHLVKSYEMLRPHIFFYEYFVPTMEGRRYFLTIYIFIITLDENGNPSFEYQKVDKFNWKRNYRYISAQTGYVIREMIKNKLGVDLR